MEYSQIEKDFVKRTLQLIEQYKGEYEVTLLINCCLGLLVLPKEKYFKSIPSRDIPINGALWGISRKSLIVDCPECGFKLNDIIRRLRNGICHFKINTIPDGTGVINQIEIKDRGKFKAVFTVNQFRELAISFGKHVVTNP